MFNRLPIVFLFLTLFTLSFPNLVPNGSFELNTENTSTSGLGGFFGDPPDEWTENGGGPSDMWDNDGNGGNVPGARNLFESVQAHDGTKWAGLVSLGQLGGHTTLESSRVFLHAGLDYSVDFSYLWEDGRYEGYDLTLGEMNLYVLTDSALMHAFTFRLTGPAKTWKDFHGNLIPESSGFVRFVFRPYADIGENVYVGVDNFRLVPEPATMAVVAMGAVGVLRRRLLGSKTAEASTR